MSLRGGEADAAIPRVLFALLLFCMTVTFHDIQAGDRWKHLRDGLEYRVIDYNTGRVHAFKVDTKKLRLGVITAKALGQSRSWVKEMGVLKRALVAVNGGFFSPEYDSLGLLVNEGAVLNPVKQTNWWSVFYVKNGVPVIEHTNNFKMNPEISMAIQSGPRLIVDGTIPKFKPSLAERSAICINSDNDVIIMATDGMVLQMEEFADVLKKPETSGGLSCKTALNLDGGSSTQLYAKVGSFELDLPGTKKIANAVVVYPK